MWKIGTQPWTRSLHSFTTLYACWCMTLPCWVGGTWRRSSCDGHGQIGGNGAGGATRAGGRCAGACTVDAEGGACRRGVAGGHALGATRAWRAACASVAMKYAHSLIVGSSAAWHHGHERDANVPDDLADAVQTNHGAVCTRNLLVVTSATSKCECAKLGGNLARSHVIS